MPHPRTGHTADRAWSWAEDELLRFLARKGHSADYIANKGFRDTRTKAAVLLRAGRIGVTFQPRGGAPKGNLNGQARWYTRKGSPL